MRSYTRYQKNPSHASELEENKMLEAGKRKTWMMGREIERGRKKNRGDSLYLFLSSSTIIFFIIENKNGLVGKREGQGFVFLCSLRGALR